MLIIKPFYVGFFNGPSKARSINLTAEPILSRVLKTVGGYQRHGGKTLRAGSLIETGSTKTIGENQKSWSNTGPKDTDNE